MTPQEIKQQAHKEFDKKFVKDSIMTNVRLIERQNPNEIKSFIDSLIDRTVQMTEEITIKKIKQDCSFGECELPGEGKCSRDYFFHLPKSYFTYLITNKSEINK